MFKAETGTSPQRCLLAFRLEQARLLLETGRKSVKETAAFVGMDLSHFTKSFKARFGLTPTAYRTGEISRRPADEGKDLSRPPDMRSVVQRLQGGIE